MYTDYFSPAKLKKKIEEFIEEGEFNEQLFNKLKNDIVACKKSLVLVSIEESLRGTRFKVVKKPASTKLTYYTIIQYILTLNKIVIPKL